MTITINGSGTITGASTLATTVASPTLTTPNIDSAQIPTVSGNAPLYMCRAWVNFNGTGTIAIRASGNVTSITDNGTGDYTVNFTTAMTDANYCLVGTIGEGTDNADMRCLTQQNRNNTTTTSRVRSMYVNSGGIVDVTIVNIAFFR